MSSDSPRPSSSTPKKKKTPSKAGKPRASSSSSPSAKAPPIVAESGSPRFHVKISDAASAHKQTLRIVVAPNRVTALKLCVGDVVSVSVAGVKVGFGVIWTTAQNLAPGVAIVSQQLALNLGLATGDEVELNQSGATLQPLAKLVLKPTSKGSDSNWIDEGCQLLAREVLRDIKYIQHGSVIEFIYQGKLRQCRAEKATALDGSVNIPDVIYNFNAKSEATLVQYDETDRKKWGSSANVSYDSIGGLSKQMEAIRNLVEVPLRDPSRFTKYGIRPPRGVLLYGPPGTGKTLIARAVAVETGAYSICINGPEIISKFYGETEERLRSIFEEAEENAPAIIFIDEIDSLVPRRDDSATDLEKRVVATLLTLMDGSDASGKRTGNGVIVMAATNRPNHIDDALRRPGRFDREVEISIPDVKDRELILAALLRKTPHTLSTTQVSDLAAAAHGFVGADLAAVCREAGMRAIQRVLQNAGDGHVSPENVRITLEDMQTGLGVVKPSSMREVLLEVPNVRWSDIGGQDDIKQRIKEAVEWPLKHPEAFARFKIRPPKGILMYGPPGCSKTLMAKALATEAGLNFLAVKGPELFSKWVGESEKAVRDIFKKARAASPSVIFFDEIDAIAVRRGSDNGSVSDRVLSQLLNEMDGIEPLINVTVIAATNRPDILDSALLRPGRMDRILYVSPPDYESRLQIFKIRTSKMACASDVDCEELARLTDGYSGAETVSVCQEAAMFAMEEDPDVAAVAQRHLIHAVGGVTPRITQEMITFYNQFREQSGLRSI